MKVTALVMAGGKGTRMALAEEKPLLKVGGRPAVVYVLEALKAAKCVDDVVVTISNCTPKTAAYLANFPVKVLKTPGKEYVADMGYAVRVLKLETIVTISADMPLITAATIDDILKYYCVCGKPALAVVVPAKTKRRLGMGLGYCFEHEGSEVVPSGINVNDGAHIDDPELDQAVYVVDKAEVAVNINTVGELRVAEQLFSQKIKPWLPFSDSSF